MRSPPKGSKSVFLKFAIRKSIDFPIVRCAAMITQSGGKITAAHICLSAVWVKPYRAVKAEKTVLKKRIDESTAEAAGHAAVADAVPLERNKYIFQIAKTMVKRAVLACGDPGVWNA